MSVDFTFSTVIGVQIPMSWLYVTSEFTPPWCDHPKPEEAKHCPECGKKRPTPCKTRDFSPDFMALVGGDEDDAWNALYNGIPPPAGRHRDQLPLRQLRPRGPARGRLARQLG